MSASIPAQEPTRFAAGDTVKWTKSLADYPPDTWTLSYSFVNSSGQFAESSSTASGGAHLVTITAADSVSLTSGTYQWQSYVTDGSDRYQVGAGTCEVVANFATATGGYDARSHVKKVLDALEAVIESRASTDQAAMSIQGRSLSRLSPEDLYRWRAFYRAEYQRELRAEAIANGLGSSGKVLVRYTT